jgi:hypothetical protein
MVLQPEAGWLDVIGEREHAIGKQVIGASERS